MGFTSVILRCPDEMYTWFEDRLTTGTVEQAMLAALRHRRLIPTPSVPILDAAPPLMLPPSEPARVLPAVLRGTRAKYCKKNNRRHHRR